MMELQLADLRGEYRRSWLSLEAEQQFLRLVSRLHPELGALGFSFLLVDACMGAIRERQQNLRALLSTDVEPTDRSQLESESMELERDYAAWKQLRATVRSSGDLALSQAGA